MATRLELRHESGGRRNSMTKNVSREDEFVILRLPPELTQFVADFDAGN
jgi:hypothetical protein